MNNDSSDKEVSMKFIFIDAENIGLPALQELNASISDKVFVFGKDDAVKCLCHQKLYYLIDNYPTGKNQADFALIGLVSKTCCEIPNELKKVSKCILYSSDQQLQNAFEHQCELCAIQYSVKSKSSVSVDMSNDESKEAYDVVSVLAKSRDNFKINELQEESGLATAPFNAAIRFLTEEKKIKKTSQNQNLWSYVPSS